MPIRTELATIIDLETGARVIPAGSDLYRQGDICSTCYIILNGWIALCVLLDDGSCQILDFALPGAVLGAQSGVHAPMYHSAHCLSAVRVYAVPRNELDGIIQTNPRLAILLCRQITADEARAHDHLTNLGLRGARERIARLLLEIYVRMHRRLPTMPSETIQVPLSQIHIAQALGLTAVHVCRTLQVLREQKIVRFANHSLEIIDPSALVAAAGIETDDLDVEHHNRLPAWAHSPAARDATGWLPVGWMPIESNTPSRMPYTPQAKAA